MQKKQSKALRIGPAPSKKVAHTHSDEAWAIKTCRTHGRSIGQLSDACFLTRFPLILTTSSFCESLHVRLRLRHDVVKVVPDGNEGEALVKELLHSICAKQEQAKNNIVCFCGCNQLAGHLIQLGRSVHLRELILLVETSTHAKVILPQEKHVNAFDCGNFIHIFNAVTGF